MTTICQWFYLAGYGGWIMPRFLRRLTARSEFHRAWVTGCLGFFEEGGVRFGPASPYYPPS
ncbi:hypothetical protein N6L27_21455 [Leisingera sp. SS27]|uniref:hypothetical protein n=1 Tax=Leisingera sp. SS27 TaxID=2979462 RepID=UPI00232F65B6|nr:hypothetical protein [Leisingera sp. SS27]MDC0660579.1 hypothetical protein [Leisingera sp. SS27]